MTQVRFHAPFRRIGDDLWRAGIDDGESAAGMADRDNGVIWISTSGGENVAGVVAHEVAHMAGAGEEAALWYQAEFEAGRLPDRIPAWLPESNAVQNLPGGIITIQEPGYYDFHVSLGFSEVATDPKVWITLERGGVEGQVWPPKSDPGIWSAPYPAKLFSGTAKAIPCLSGDRIRVYIRHSSDQPVDMTGTFTAELIDRTKPVRLETPEVIEYVTDAAGVDLTLTLTLSEAPEPGDVLVLVLVLMSRTLTGVSGDGWQTHGSYSERYVMSKVAGSGESDSVTITTTNSGLIRYTHGALIRLRNTAAAIDTAANSGNSGEGHTAPSVNGAQGGLLLVCWGCQTSGLSVPEGLTELIEEHRAGGSTIAVGYRQTGPGATGDYAADLDDHGSSHPSLGVQLAFGPESG